MSRVVTAPMDDTRMWKRLLARAHPDHGGSEDLFVWTMELREQVRPGTRDVPHGTVPQNSPRLVFGGEDFDAITSKALDLAHEHQGTVFGYLLGLLNGCVNEPIRQDEQGRGASYRRLAAIGHAAGMDKAERGRWYRIAEGIPLTDAHARFILGRLGGEGRAAM